MSERHDYKSVQHYWAAIRRHKKCMACGVQLELYKEPHINSIAFVCFAAWLEGPTHQHRSETLLFCTSCAATTTKLVHQRLAFLRGCRPVQICAADVHQAATMALIKHYQHTHGLDGPDADAPSYIYVKIIDGRRIKWQPLETSEAGDECVGYLPPPPAPRLLEPSLIKDPEPPAPITETSGTQLTLIKGGLWSS